MGAGNWVAVLSVLLTAFVAVFSLFWNTRTQERFRAEQREAEARKREIERIHEPQIEFDISARFFRDGDAASLVEIRLNLRNVGRVQQKLHNPTIKIKGMEAGTSPPRSKSYPDRVYFPVALVEKTSAMPGNWNYIFVEPGVRQDVTFVTSVPEGIGHIVVRAQFDYEPNRPHNAERVFEVGVDFASPIATA